MEQGFIDILKKVVEKHGKESFLELKKCRAIVSDYTGADYRIEKGLLLRAVEQGVSNAIIIVEEGDLDSCMKAQQRNLQEEQFMDSAVAENIVNILANVLRGIALKNIQAESKGDSKEFDEAMGFYHDQQYDKALQIFEALAKENHAGAQTYIGDYYYQGIVGNEDKSKAVEYFRKAADQGYARAQVNLGNCYLSGKGITEDKAKAIELYHKAIDQNFASGKFFLGYCYETGDGVPQDYAKAVEWYQIAAAQGNPGAIKGLNRLKKAGKI